MGDTSYINVNGKEFAFGDTEKSVVKVYNLSPLLVLAYDIFFITDNYDSYVWLMTKTEDSFGVMSPKFSVILDGNADGTFSGFEREITGGNPGDAFSNPITYIRRGVPGAMAISTPTHNDFAVKSGLSVFSGSSRSSKGSNWLSRINGDNLLVSGYTPSYESGPADTSLNPRHIGDVDKGKQIEAIYIAVLNRVPMLSESTMWSLRLEQNYKIEDLLFELFTSSEYKSTPIATSTDEEFINILYGRSIGRAPEQQEVDYFLKRLGTSNARLSMLGAVVKSPEFIDHWALGINTFDDFLTLGIKKLSTVSKEELSIHLKNTIIVIRPSDHVDFSDIYLYADNEAIEETDIGIRYKF